MAYHPTRPNCEHLLPSGAQCNSPGHQIGTLVNGGKTWRVTNGLWTCMYHHYLNCPQQHPHRMYTLHKKTYCENIDRRLGKICTTTITHPKELTVDHIDGNHKNDNPLNLQTLCACCHNLKTHQDYLNRGHLGTSRILGNCASESHSDFFGDT